MRKVFLWIIILLILAGGIWVVAKWRSAEGISEDAFNIIPADAIYCISTSDPINSWKEISGSRTWSHLQKNTYFASLTAAANSLDSLVKDNEFLFDLIGSRALVVSAHMTEPEKYDFLFLADLEKASGIKFLNEYLANFSAAGYAVRTEKYKEDDIVVLFNREDKSSIYLSLPGTYMLASFTKKLVTAALDTYQGRAEIAATKLIKSKDDLENSGIMQLFLNYEMLPKFMGCYASEPNEYVNRLSEALQTSNMSVTLDDDLIKATGYTYVVDSIESYVKTLSISGSGTTEFMEIAPQRTAFCLGLGFNSFAEFFANFEKNLQQDVQEYNEYKDNLKQVESYLNISLQENFINWIGDEVALFELQSSGKGLVNEMALVLKAHNIEKAKGDLAHIEKMVKRRTPVKFKAVDHRGYSINYLSMKGLFKVLLGKFFARYDKPYYTIVNNFVIFSNHPQTLESIIDDYLDKNTLLKSDEFRSFRKEFDDESSVFVYLNTPVLFNTMKKLSDSDTRVAMENNKEFIVCFRQIGFQLVPESERFKTIFAEQFVEPEPLPVIAEVDTAEDSITVDTTAVLPGEADPMQLPDIYAENINASPYTAYFPDSTTHYKVELKNGFKNGSFIEYYPNGEIKMTGHFKDDKRDGTWRLYNESGKLVRKRNYEEGEVKRERARDQ